MKMKGIDMDKSLKFTQTRILDALTWKIDGQLSAILTSGGIVLLSDVPGENASVFTKVLGNNLVQMKMNDDNMSDDDHRFVAENFINLVDIPPETTAEDGRG